MDKRIKTAFTLVELLVVIAIIGILSGLIIVGMNSSVQSATIAKAQIFSNSLRNSLMGSLVSEWKLDGSTNDSWSSNNCTWYGSGGGSNTSANWRPTSECVYDQCLDFDGTDDYLNCGNSTSLNFVDAITIEAWIKTDQLYADFWRAIVGKNGYSVYSLFAEVGNNTRFEIDSGGTRYVVNGPSFVGNIGKWMHVAGTYNSGEGILKVYYNGQIYATNNIGQGKNIDTNTAPIQIGGRGTNMFNGMIDGVRLYNSAISTSQIREQYYIGWNRLLAGGNINTAEYQGALIAR